MPTIGARLQKKLRRHAEANQKRYRPLSLIKGKGKKALENAGRYELVDFYDHCRGMGNEWLRRQIVDNNRIDILATAILGYEVKPLHLAMLKWQFAHPDSLLLAFRGAGKSSVCTIVKAIHYLIKNRNFRILLPSKTATNAEGFLKEIKGHLEDNRRLIEIFGEFYDPQRVVKWDNREIEVLGRTRRVREASITCVGVDGTIISKHYDAILSDDLVDEDNTRTKYMRDRTRTWYYQTLDPCLEPPSPTVPHRGEHHRSGTRYHYDDLYGHWIANELQDDHLVIPGLDEEGCSPWPEKYPPKWFEGKKRKAGLIIFNSQYQCDTEAMKGEIFQYDDCQQLEDSDVPKDLRKFMGVDLAISEKDKDKNDKFAMVVIGLNKAGECYVLDYYDGHIRFNEQTKQILRFYRQYDPIRCAIETNAYQAAQYQNLKDKDKELRMRPVHQDKDKITRAWKLSARFEEKRMFFRKGLGTLIDQMVLFPNYRYKDGFDALDLAIRASRMRKRRKRRREEPGVL